MTRGDQPVRRERGGSRAALGRLGEEVAADHLTERGLTVVERNWRCRSGEIDLVARDGDCLVVVEVPTRASRRFGEPEDSLGRANRARLALLARLYWHETSWDGPCRVDVLAVRMDRRGRVTRVTHYPNAVTGLWSPRT